MNESENELSAGPPAIVPPPITSHRSAEEFAAQWLRFLGEEKVRVTAASGDGGLDVVTKRLAVQVKRYAKGTPVGRPEIQRLVGATPKGLLAIFLTSGRYTDGAREYANQRGVSLYQFRFSGNRWPTKTSGTGIPEIKPQTPIGKKVPAKVQADMAIAHAIRKRVSGAEALPLSVVVAIVRETRRITSS